MLVKFQNKTNGDTLIEVLFAITIFSLVAVGGISIMNQGTATSQRALEISMVRNEIDAQAEALRFLNASYVAAFQNGATGYSGSAGEWAAIESLTKNVTSASAFGNTASCANPPTGSFVINTHTGKLEPSGKLGKSSTFSRIRYDGSNNVVAAEGLWIEAVHPTTATLTAMDASSQDNTTYVDFNIRACWDSLGQATPVTMGTIVRLYVPRYDPTPLPPLPPPTAPPANTPSAPVVSVVNTVGAITNYSWTAVTCDSGYTPSYRYRYVIDYSGGFTSGWTTTVSRLSSYNTSDQGYQFTLQVQAQCVGGPSPSGWGTSGSVSYIRPVSMPGAVAYGITKTSSTSVDLRATSSCTASPNVYLYSRMDVYITPSYGGWNWWWGDTRVGGWYASSHGPWLIDAWNWYGDTITVTMNMNPLWSGFPWRVAVELKCQNMVTGRASASTGRQESGNLNTP